MGKKRLLALFPEENGAMQVFDFIESLIIILHSVSKSLILVISSHFRIFHNRIFSEAIARSAHNRANDRSNDERLYCNDQTGYPKQAANSIVAGHLLRQLIQHIKVKFDFKMIVAKISQNIM